MGSRTTTQLLLIIISIVIITTYIRPTFLEMQSTQDETQEYRDALDNAAKFNSELQSLVSKANGFPTTQRRALERYLPVEVDTIAVMRDIETIVNNNNMELAVLTAAGDGSKVQFTPAQGQTQNLSQMISHTFDINVVGTYDQFKLLLQDFERNAYPLEAMVISFSSENSEETGGSNDTYSFTISLATYALTSSKNSE